jgi:hypothetical protein
MWRHERTSPPPPPCCMHHPPTHPPTHLMVQGPARLVLPEQAAVLLQRLELDVLVQAPPPVVAARRLRLRLAAEHGHVPAQPFGPLLRSLGAPEGFHCQDKIRQGKTVEVHPFIWGVRGGGGRADG